MYYLHSRYYDPEVCRFINTDAFASTGQGIIGYNMFAYCGNNPVNFSDSGGSKMECCVMINDGGGKLLSGQNLAPYRDMPYGNSTIGHAGCEAMGIYNFMLLIGKPRSFTSIISFMVDRFNNASIFSLSGWGHKGKLGATPGDISAYLSSQSVECVETTHFWILKNCCTAPGAFLISYWNEDLLQSGYHTIAISYDGATYNGYNRDTYNYAPVPRASLSDFMAGDWRFIYGVYVPYS